MIGQIIFTVIAFLLFLYILFFKMVKKNDTTYLIILGIQAIGILLNLINITFSIFPKTLINVVLYLLCIIVPILVFVLEERKINVSEKFRITIAKIHLVMNKTDKAKKTLIDLISKYKDSYSGHKMLAQVYEKKNELQKAIDEYVQVLDLKNNDYASYYRISVLLNKLGKDDEAIQMLRTILKNRPQFIDASKLLRRNIFKTK